MKHQPQTFLGERGEHVIALGLRMKDLYQIIYDRIDYIRPAVETDIDAVCQNACCEIEKKLGIFPNVPHLKEVASHDH